VPSGQTNTPQHDRSAALYSIVEITSQGSETFLEGFEEVGEAWDVVSRLSCADRQGGVAIATSPFGMLQTTHPDCRPAIVAAISQIVG
jgi:hypothetical protein